MPILCSSFLDQAKIIEEGGGRHWGKDNRGNKKRCGFFKSWSQVNFHRLFNIPLSLKLILTRKIISPKNHIQALGIILGYSPYIGNNLLLNIYWIYLILSKPLYDFMSIIKWYNTQLPKSLLTQGAVCTLFSCLLLIYEWTSE